MRILLAGAAAIALSGCSWLGLGNNNNYNDYGYNANTGYYGQQAQQAPKVAPKACNSHQCLSRWNLEAAIGPSFVVGGNAITGDDTNAGSGANINEISFNEGFDRGWRGELGGSYALSPNRKVTANVFYDEANGSGPLDLGTIGADQLTGQLSDYQSYGAEIGVRQYFAPRRAPLLKSIRPYVAAKLGVARVEDISLENAQVAGAAFGAGPIPLTDSDWVGSAAGLFGVETPIARYTTLALESGIRYTQSPSSDNSVLSPGTPLAGINNGGGRLSIPVMLRGRYRF